MKPITETVYENESVRFVLTTHVVFLGGIRSDLSMQIKPIDPNALHGCTTIATQRKGKHSTKALANLHKLARVECESIVAARLAAFVRAVGEDMKLRPAERERPAMEGE